MSNPSPASRPTLALRASTSRLRGRSAASRARSLGYTAIEVLVALTLFAVGTAGVLSLQRASIVGASDARRTDVATAIGAEWIERLRQDSLAWTLPSADNPTGPSNLASATKILSANPIPTGPAGTSDAGADTTWFTPPVAPDATTLLDRGTSAYDLVGRGLLASEVATDGSYCVQYRLQWIIQDSLIRAEVRVHYLTSGGRVTCPASGDPNNPAGFPNGYRSVHLTTTLRQNPS